MAEAERAIPDARHEPSDVSERFIWGALALLLGSLAAIGLLVWWLFPHSVPDRTLRPPLPVYPAPRLQPSPRADMQHFYAAEMHRLNSVGWVDKAHGIVHIPIADAMREIAQARHPGLAGGAGTTQPMNFFLPAASANAAEADHLLLALLLISVAVLALVFGLMLLYVVKYRAGSSIDRGAIAQKTWRLETGWTVATLLVFFGLFIWGADLYVRLFQPPPGALKIYIIGKQWMWKVGACRRPARDRRAASAGRPPDRAGDDLRGRDPRFLGARLPHQARRAARTATRRLWFTADRPGTYHLFCTQFCGTDHSKMVGEIVAMPAPEYQKWLEQNGAADTLAAAGQDPVHALRLQRLPRRQRRGRQQAGGTVRAPPLAGLYGSPVPLSDGTVVTADDRYHPRLDPDAGTSRSWRATRRSCRPSPARSARKTS